MTTSFCMISRSNSSERETVLAGKAEFAPTAWTVIVKAREKDSPSCMQAMDALCRVYWYPVYAFIRRQGYSSADAQDFTQELLAQLMSPAGLARVDRRKGRFRRSSVRCQCHLIFGIRFCSQA